MENDIKPDGALPGAGKDEEREGGKNKKQMKTVAEALQERGQGDAWNACFTHRRNINTHSHTHANATQMHSDWTEPGKKKKKGKKDRKQTRTVPLV